MRQVVQATCPGCQGVLRIPSQWLGQSIRCKQCGIVLQTKAKAAPETTDAETEKRPASPGPRRSTPPPPLPRTRQATTPPPKALPVEESTASPFDFGAEEEEIPVRRRRGAKRRANWILPVVGMLAVGVLAGLLYGVYVQTTRHGQEKVAQGEPEEGKNNARREVDPRAIFPRRALIISVHNYLYANPIAVGPKDSQPIAQLVNAISRGLRMAPEQVIHLSDAASKQATPPLKAVIQQTLSNFLKTSRKQDRIVILFVGHTKEIENEAYLVPLEGELDNAESLLPLKWVYEQLEQCPARQKVLILDGNRFNSGQGEERPSSGPMSEKFAAAVQAPPKGVQVWTSCSAGQLAQEFEGAPLGLFLDQLRQALVPEKGQKGALEGTIPHPDDLLPVETLHTAVNDRMARECSRLKVSKQVGLLAGKAPSEGADYDRNEALAAAPALPIVEAGDRGLIQEIMNEISLPPIKGGETNSLDVEFSLLPPFKEETMKAYRGGDLPRESKLRKAVHEARLALWAYSTAKPPQDLAEEVKQLRQKLKVDLSIMRERYGKPGAGAAETAFKNRIYEDSRAMAPVVARLENILEQLREAGEEKDAAPKRWQANYLFILARFQAQLAYLEEYQGLLGQLRRELPEHDPEVHSAFRMASTEKTSDTTGKKLERAARKIYADLAKEYQGTPWEVLAKREKLTALGLVWKPTSE